MLTGYIIKAQGYEPGRQVFPTLKEAKKAVRMLVKSDVRDCRRHFGTAVTQMWDNGMWEVRPLKERNGPLWSRYSIHAVGR